MSASPSMLKGLKARPKRESVEEIRAARGFADRAPRRKPSPRTHQLHPKVLPATGVAIADEAERLGLTQGQMIERLWQVYAAGDRGA